MSYPAATTADSQLPTAPAPAPADSQLPTAPAPADSQLPTAPAPTTADSQLPTAPAPAIKENLLAAPTASSQLPTAPATAPADPASTLPTPEAVASLATAITPALEPLPDGSAIPIDGEAINLVSAVFARHGVTEAAAKEIVASYASHARQQILDAQAADAKLNADMVDECRRVLGPDLARYVAEARKGGADIFGPELFNQLCSVETFANDHRILAALAARGRAITSDPAPGGAGTKTDERDLAARLYGASAG